MSDPKLNLLVVQGEMTITKMSLVARCEHCGGEHALILSADSKEPQGRFELRLPRPVIDAPGRKADCGSIKKGGDV